MRPILIIPGYGDSGPGHWQSLWEANLRYAKRVQMPNWFFPHRTDWVEALDTAIREASQSMPPVLVAHSLGCLAVAHWALHYQRPIHGALLVAPVDVERADALEAVKEFAPIPMFGLPFPSHVVASSNDPMASLDRSRALAEAWNSQFTEAGIAGHINTASGYGEWPRGEAFLQDLI
jgi:predicted alpha/beta hydrolase family esterase